MGGKKLTEFLQHKISSVFGLTLTLKPLKGKKKSVGHGQDTVCIRIAINHIIKVPNCQTVLTPVDNQAEVKIHLHLFPEFLSIIHVSIQHYLLKRDFPSLLIGIAL